MTSNRAAWITAPKAHPFQIRESALLEVLSGDDILVKVHAWAINPIDQVVQAQGSSMSYPWLKYPAILGYDVAGEVIKVGSKVNRFAAGDRVFGLSYGCEKSEVTKHGGKAFPRSGFQEYVLLSDHMTARIPSDEISYEQACVLPLGLSTAAAGLFQEDQLHLQLPSLNSTPKNETLLIWGGSSSVGLNAIQLAVNAGYEVITTCSPRNFELVRRLGASTVFDYNSKTVVQDIIKAFHNKTCAGAFTTGTGGAEKAFDILARVSSPSSSSSSFATSGTTTTRKKKHIAMATYPVPDPAPTNLVVPRTVVHFVSFLVGAWWKKVTTGVEYKFIWGGTVVDNGIGKQLFVDFLEQALEQRKYVCSPEPMVVGGKGVESLQDGIDVLAKGVSAKKVVVTI